ncbi:hypothetical protein HK405_002512, partial [Cladochytrium tenue]
MATTAATMVLRACNRGFAATSAAWLPRLSPGAAAAAKLRGAWNKPSVRPAAPPSDEQLAMRTKLPVPASQVAAPAPGAKAVSGKRRRAAASVAAASNSTKEQRIPASFVRTEFPPSGKEQSRRARLQVPKRYLTDTETGVPMPTTFADRDMTPRIFRARLTARRGMPTDKVDQDAPLSATAVDGGSRHHQYPYRFYQITLRRGLIGLPESTRRVVAR